LTASIELMKPHDVEGQIWTLVEETYISFQSDINYAIGGSTTPIVELTVSSPLKSKTTLAELDCFNWPLWWSTQVQLGSPEREEACLFCFLALRLGPCASCRLCRHSSPLKSKTTLAELDCFNWPLWWSTQSIATCVCMCWLVQTFFRLCGTHMVHMVLPEREEACLFCFLALKPFHSCSRCTNWKNDVKSCSTLFGSIAGCIRKWSIQKSKRGYVKVNQMYCSF
jgi:hypothetical protein